MYLLPDFHCLFYDKKDESFAEYRPISEEKMKKEVDKQAICGRCRFALFQKIKKFLD